MAKKRRPYAAESDIGTSTRAQHLNDPPIRPLKPPRGKAKGTRGRRVGPAGVNPRPRIDPY